MLPGELHLARKPAEVRPLPLVRMLAEKMGLTVHLTPVETDQRDGRSSHEKSQVDRLESGIAAVVDGLRVHAEAALVSAGDEIQAESLCVLALVVAAAVLVSGPPLATEAGGTLMVIPPSGVASIEH